MSGTGRPGKIRTTDGFSLAREGRGPIVFVQVGSAVLGDRMAVAQRLPGEDRAGRVVRTTDVVRGGAMATAAVGTGALARLVARTPGKRAVAARVLVAGMGVTATRAERAWPSARSAVVRARPRSHIKLETRCAVPERPAGASPTFRAMKATVIPGVETAMNLDAMGAVGIRGGAAGTIGMIATTETTAEKTNSFGFGSGMDETLEAIGMLEDLGRKALTGRIETIE